MVTDEQHASAQKVTDVLYFCDVPAGVVNVSLRVKAGRLLIMFGDEIVAATDSGTFGRWLAGEGWPTYSEGREVR